MVLLETDVRRDRGEVNCEMEKIFVRVESERELPHNSASHSNALVENPFDDQD
ncbi:hypothetical protein GCM10022247_14700 [Allokutzneria multivorans]|uniref:Uncharacterized protein n=1 Tax=Allokutzneria multivorans TaxID=1142134 RepID=A0ABP7RDA6_9PSEU